MLLVDDDARAFMKQTMGLMVAKRAAMRAQGKSFATSVASDLGDGAYLAKRITSDDEFLQAIDVFGTPADTFNAVALAASLVVTRGKPEIVNLFLDRTQDGIMLNIQRNKGSQVLGIADVLQSLETFDLPGMETAQVVEYTGPISATQYQMMEAMKRAINGKSPYRAFTAPNFTYTVAEKRLLG